MRTLAGVVALAVLFTTGSSSRSDEPKEPELLKAVERQLKAVYETAGPVVAWVVVSRSEKYPKPSRPPEHPGQLGGFDPKAFTAAHPGSAELARQLDLSDPVGIPDHTAAGGVILNSTGLILTNYHTIEGATKIYVYLSGGVGSYADIHAADGRSDLAVLRLLTPPPGLRQAEFADVVLPPDGRKVATIFQGKLAILLGSPVAGPRSSGLGSITDFSRKTTPKQLHGWLAVGPPAHRSIYNYAHLIVHNARSSPACSGLPLLDLDGKVIGLSTTASGIDNADAGTGHALPLDNTLKRIIDVLSRGEEVEYGYLGVRVIDQNDRRPGIVVSVAPQGPAAFAGLIPEDPSNRGRAPHQYQITRVDEHPIRNYEDLLLYTGSALAGSKVRVEYSQPGEGIGSSSIDVTLGKFRGDTPVIASVRPAPVFGLRVDYATVLTQREGGTLPGGGVSGVAVREMTTDSPAATKFKAIADGNRWLITHVNGSPVAGPADFYRLTTGQSSIRLAVVNADTGTAHAVTLP